MTNVIRCYRNMKRRRNRGIRLEEVPDVICKEDVIKVSHIQRCLHMEMLCELLKKVFNSETETLLNVSFRGHPSVYSDSAVLVMTAQHCKYRKQLTETVLEPINKDDKSNEHAALKHRVLGNDFCLRVCVSARG